MSLRDAALAAAKAHDDRLKADREAYEARIHYERTAATRAFFNRVGVAEADVEIDGLEFVIDGMHGRVSTHDNEATILWFQTPGTGGGIYETAKFSDLAGLGRAFTKTDVAKARGTFHQRRKVT